MTKADLFTLIDRPEIAGVYVFGSYSDTTDPNDIDILLVYDEGVCPPCQAHELLRQLVLQLESFFATKLHLALLSEKEIAHNDFLASEDCISLAAMLEA